MNKKTLKALKASITHWQKMRRNPDCGERPRASSCPLCQLFNDDKIPINDLCKGCPVFARTNRVFCVETPYRSAAIAWLNLQILGRSGFSKWRTAATAEINFLKSLLPSSPQSKIKNRKSKITR